MQQQQQPYYQQGPPPQYQQQPQQQQGAGPVTGGPQTQQYVVVPTAALVNSPVFHSSQPVQCICPLCHASIVTTISYQSGVLTWIICLILFWFLACFAFIVFCVDAAKDVVHTCPSCGAQLGVCKRIG